MVEKQSKPPWNREERIERKAKKGETEKGEEDASIGLGEMFSEDGKN
jgi:hypothetical protein